VKADDRQVLAPSLKRHYQFQPDAGLAFDERLRLGTG